MMKRIKTKEDAIAFVLYMYRNMPYQRVFGDVKLGIYRVETDPPYYYENTRRHVLKVWFEDDYSAVKELSARVYRKRRFFNKHRKEW